MWAIALFCVVCGVLTAIVTRRTVKANRAIRAEWAAEAPPVGPVDVVLRTGERLTVEPILMHRAWIWGVPVPRSSLVEEILIPELPPWTQLIPVPPPAHEVLREEHR
jgi:hypothetical protein